MLLVSDQMSGAPTLDNPVQGCDDMPEGYERGVGSLGDRMTRLETKFETFSVESREDRRGIRDKQEENMERLEDKLDEMQKVISGQLQKQASASAYIEVLKWAAALIVTAVGGYFFSQLTDKVQHNAAAIEQHQQQQMEQR
jgi:hypothetical protein